MKKLKGREKMYIKHNGYHCTCHHFVSWCSCERTTVLLPPASQRQSELFGLRAVEKVNFALSDDGARKCTKQLLNEQMMPQINEYGCNH